MANFSFFRAYRRKIRQRSAGIPRKLKRITLALAIGWSGLFFAAASFRILASPLPAHGLQDWLEILIPYAMVAFGPLAGYLTAAAGISYQSRRRRLAIHLSRVGSWRAISWRKARTNQLFGPAGFMASLLIGLLLNIVLRSFEFLLAVPPLNNHAPAWGQQMFLMMAADVAVMSFFYMISFVLALKAIPLFPKTLLLAWSLDILIQLLIAHRLGSIGGIPAEVAAPLGDLLQGNINKVLISAFVWIPYLVLSNRVNLTYRRRIPRE